MEISIRRGKLNDLSQVVELIGELAENTYGIKSPLTVYDLIKDGFSIHRFYKLFVATKNEKIIGFAIFYKSYSIYGRSLIIEEVFVTKKYKKFGVGLSLFSKCLEYALKKKVKQIEWAYDEQFSSLKELYERAGAKVLTDMNLVCVYKDNINKSVKLPPTIKENTFTEIPIIRYFEPKDTKVVFSLFQKIISTYNINSKISEQDLINDGFSKRPKFTIFVLEIENQIVGFSLLYPAYSIAYGKGLNIQEMYIDEAYRNYGFGKAFVHFIIQYAKKEHINKISLLINKQDIQSLQRANDFYGEIVKGKKIVRITSEALNNFINN